MRSHVSATLVTTLSLLIVGAAAAAAPNSSTPSSISLVLEPATASRKGQLTGTLVTAGGAPIANAPVQLSVTPLDGPGVYAEYTATGTVPAGATAAIVGIRLNTECDGLYPCDRPSDLALSETRYFESEETRNRVPYPRFERGLEYWGAGGTAAIRLEPRQGAPGQILHITATSMQRATLNSTGFPVAPGASFRLTFLARVSPASVGSGYFMLEFNDGQAPRVQLAIEAGLARRSATTGSSGAFTIDLGELPGSKLELRTALTGDVANGASSASLTHVPAATTLAVSPPCLLIGAGESRRLDASLTDQLGNDMALEAVTWTASPTTLCAVDPAGILTAGAVPSTGTVSARASGLSGEVKVTVSGDNIIPTGAPVVVNPPLTTGGPIISLASYLTDAQGAPVTPYKAMIHALEACRSVAGATLLIPPGRYVFDDPEIPVSPFTVVDVQFHSDLTIDGQGAELVFVSPHHHALVLYQCHRVLVKDLVIDYDLLVGSRGLVQKEPDGQTSVRIADEFPVDASTPVYAATAFDFERMRWLTNDGDTEWVENPKLIRPQTFASPSFAGLKEGQTVLVRHPWGFGHAVAVRKSSDITFEAVTVYGSPFIAFSMGADRGQRLSHCAVRHRPGSGRVISSKLDGIHVGMTLGQIVVEDSEVEGMGDDAVAFYAVFFSVVNKVDARTLLVRYTGTNSPLGEPEWLESGATLVLRRRSDLAEILRCRATSVSYEAATCSYTVMVDQDLPSSVVPGDLVANVSRCSSHHIVRRNFIHANRSHGAFLNAPDALIEGNAFRGIPLSGAICDVQALAFVQGPGCEDLVIRGNTFEGCGNERYDTGMAALSIASRVEGAHRFPATAVHKNLMIEDNWIESTPQLGLLLGSSDSVTARANTIVDANTAPFDGMGSWFGAPASGSIMVTRASNVTVEENHQRITRETYDSGVYVDIGTTSAITTLDNTIDTSVSFLVPVVLGATGSARPPATTDLVLQNRAQRTTTASLRYRPAPGTPGSEGVAITETLGAGRELRIPDLLPYLRAKGYALPTSGASVRGLVVVEFLETSDESLVWAGSRSATPNGGSGGGRLGTLAPSTEKLRASYTSATVFGLREDDLFHSSLSIADVASGSGPARVAIQVTDGDTGLPVGDPVELTLQADDWKELGTVLADRGVHNGYATVTRTGGGSNRFLVWGVVTDSASGDQSWVWPDARKGILPVVQSARPTGPAVTMELVLANPTTHSSRAILRFTPMAPSSAPKPSARTTIELDAGRQVRIADLVGYLGDHGVPVPDGTTQGGTLEVDGAVALARVSTPNPDAATGGTVGCFVPAQYAAHRAEFETWVHGLRQDATTRSDLVIVDARVGAATVERYVVEVHDADRGAGFPAQTVGPIVLAGGQSYEFTSILASCGIQHGYAHVRSDSGISDFAAYAVLRDGAVEGQGSSDASFIPMTRGRDEPLGHRPRRHLARVK